MIVIDDKLKKEIGSRLANLRKQYNYTINNIIEKLCGEYYFDINEKTIRRYEKGDFLPKIDYLIAFSELYETTLDYIVFGKKTSDDNSYTFKDNFKRLNRLIYSCILFPWKEEDKESKYYDKYIFTGYDEELALYIDRVMNYVRNKNYSFEVRGKKPFFNIHDLDNLIQEFEEYKEQLAPPTPKRLNNIMIKSGGNPQKYLENKMQIIKKKRKT